MNKLNIIFLIMNLIMLLGDLFIFLKYRKIKKDIENNLKTISDEPEIFLDFFGK